MSDLGLNQTHEEEIKKFLKFARYNRQQQLRSVEGSFQDLKDSRLHEDTFTVDEVSQMLDGLQAVVKGAVETELLNAAHTNVLLLVQLFAQAERWHLKLQADISELENQRLLKDIQEFDEQEITGVKKKNIGSALKAQKKLQPLNEGGSSALLHMEIERLKEENSVLKSKIKTLEINAVSGIDERSKLKSDLKKAKHDAEKHVLPSQPSDEEISLLSDRVSTLSESLRQAEEMYKSRSSNVEEELTDTKHYVLALQHELETVNAELDKKFSETTQFRNLKKMLEGKNTQLKELRNRIKIYEPECEL